MNDNKTYREKIEELREQICADIISLMNRHGLTRIDISDEASDDVWLIRYDDDGIPYECSLVAVIVEKDIVKLVGEEKFIKQQYILDSRYDTSARNVHSLMGALENIDETLCIQMDKEDEKKRDAEREVSHRASAPSLAKVDSCS